MIEKVNKTIRGALIFALALGVPTGVANAQEGEEAPQDIQNVLLTFHLVEADGFTDDDPEISDVVTELRKLFNFRGYRLLSTSVFNVGLIRTQSSANWLEGTGSQRIAPVDSESPLMISAEISSRRATRTVRAKVALSEVTTRSIGLLGTEPLPLLEVTATLSDDQRMVLGTPRRAAGEPVLILIVTARIDPDLGGARAAVLRRGR